MGGVVKYTMAEFVDEETEYNGVVELFVEDVGNIEPAFESVAGQRTLEDTEHLPLTAKLSGTSSNSWST